MLARRPKESREGYSVFIATSLLLLVAMILGGIGAHVVDRMRSSANALDDNRAILAAEAAVSSFKEKLAATVRDNAVWDDAYKAITQGIARVGSMRIGARPARTTRSMTG